MTVGASRYEAEARVLSPESETVLINAIQNLSREKYGWGEGIVVEIVPLAGIGQL